VADVGVTGLRGFGSGRFGRGRTTGKGAGQLGLSVGATAAETWALKHTVHETRPNGKDERSFPSGHTSVAFASAGYIQQRYGWQAGLPATAVADAGRRRPGREATYHHW
jgi:membrane-associated phospholipid phosphatase